MLSGGGIDSDEAWSSHLLSEGATEERDASTFMRRCAGCGVRVEWASRWDELTWTHIFNTLAGDLGFTERLDYHALCGATKYQLSLILCISLKNCRRTPAAI